MQMLQPHPRRLLLPSVLASFFRRLILVGTDKVSGATLAYSTFGVCGGVAQTLVSSLLGSRFLNKMFSKTQQPFDQGARGGLPVDGRYQAGLLPVSR